MDSLVHCASHRVDSSERRPSSPPDAGFEPILLPLLDTGPYHNRIRLDEGWLPSHAAIHVLTYVPDQ